MSAMQNGVQQSAQAGMQNEAAREQHTPGKRGVSAASFLRAFLIFVAWAGFVPWFLMLMSIVLETWRYYDLTAWWYDTSNGDHQWVANNKMLSADLDDGYGARDYLGGGYFEQFIVWWWVPAFTSILAIGLLPHVPYANRVGSQKGASSLIRKIKAISAYQLPPRRLLNYVIGGLTVLEAFLLAVWIVLHAVMFWNWYTTYTKGYDYVDRVIGMNFAQGIHLVKFERAALAAGWLCFLDVAVLFWPIARNSFLNQILGVPYPVLIRFHRWVGHTTMWSTTAHGVWYYIYWGLDHERSGWTQFADWGKLSGINNLAGSVSWFFGMALWLTSFNLVRRNWYQMWHSVHIIGFLGYSLFAIVHYAGMWVAFVPGLFLYAADVVIRLCQQANITTVTEWRVIGKGNNKSLVITLPVDKAVVQKPLQDYWVNFPGVSRWHWHPLTCLYPHQSTEEVKAVTFAMKCKGKWTNAVLNSVINHQHVPVRVNGPVGGESILSVNYDQLLLVAGGVGVIPLLSVLEDIVQRRIKGGVDGALLPKGVRLVWTSREREEFTLLSESIMAAACGNEKWLQVDLIYSGSVVVTPGQNLHGTPDQLKAHKLEDEGTAVNSLVKAHPAGKSFFKEENGAVSLSSDPQSTGGCPLKFPGMSPLFWDRVRPIQPDVLGNWHFVLISLFTFVGGYFGAVLGQAMMAETYTTYALNPSYWKGAWTIFATILVMCMGLPLALVVFPAHFFRYIRSRRQSQAVREASLMAAGNMRSASLLMDEKVGFHESGMWLPIKIGKLDIPTTLSDAASALKGQSVGVYVAGPEPMVQAVSMMAWGMNDKRKGAYLHVHRATYEL